MTAPRDAQLGHELRQIVSDQPFTPDVGAIERRGRQRRRRRYAVRGLAGVAGAGVALAGGLTISTHAGTTSGQQAGAASAQTVAYVRQQIVAALNPGNYLIESRQNTSSIGSPATMITIWTDPRTGNTMLLQGDGASKLSYWEHDYYDSRRVLHWDQTQVNYGPRTWWTWDQHAAGPVQGPAPSGPAGGAGDTPQQIPQLLALGATIVGHPYVDGHRTVELSVGKAGFIQMKIWADSRTYQLVRTAKYFPPKLQAPPIVADYSWVARSAAQVNLINHPAIPAGFTQVAGPTG